MLCALVVYIYAVDMKLGNTSRELRGIEVDPDVDLIATADVGRQRRFVLYWR